ncbi:MAG: ATP-binding protein [Pseudolabrys sp.]|nr:ATP-binding protein [Pseudolabrys sp.]MDP2297193.1 ATP-binding protein [Pseudolabrys sp.]
MTAQQKIVRVRRNYNQWVANQTLEDYALRFTAKSARRWSGLRVANTAIGAISFLALEAIGGAITINYGFTNATAAILVVGTLIFLTGLPIAYYAATYGVDIDLLTRGGGFGYIGSTITSLIYASFTFLFFAIEAAIMSLALEMCFGVPLFVGYVVSSLVVIPLVTHGITFISRFQLWTQPIWIVLHLLPFIFIAAVDLPSFKEWTEFRGVEEIEGNTFNLALFGVAATVVFSLIAQIGEQVDFLRFLPPRGSRNKFAWWASYLSAGPGWIIPGILKMLAGAFLAVLAVRHLVPMENASEPTQMYLVAFQYAFSSPNMALAFTGAFVIISQLKINVTNAYAGSIAWSNFFSRLTHSHPGRVVWMVFNVMIALLLMELGIFKALERILGFYSIVAVAWVGALVADLVINKPLGLSPPMIEFKRAHLYDINPVGVGAMVLATAAGILALTGALGTTLQPLAAFLALAVAFVSAPAIAYATDGAYYIARTPKRDWGNQTTIRCVMCEHHFEPEDMAQCPAYSGAICSLCCSLETRCHDLCKPHARLSNQFLKHLRRLLPESAVATINTNLGRYLGVLLLFSGLIGVVLALVYFQITLDSYINWDGLKSALWTTYFILTIIAGIGAWLLVLAQESRRIAEEETSRQTDLLMQEIEAHKRTDAKLQRAKEVAEAASEAKSRHLVGLSHELRTPLNSILGYAQVLERDPNIPPKRTAAVKVIRHSAEHLSGLIDGLLDISKIEAGRFHLDRAEVHTKEFLNQLVAMFQLQAAARGIGFHFFPPERLPFAVNTDENRLRQILINLLSNAIKFTDAGSVTFRMNYRNEVTEFIVEDTGIGIHADDLERIFQPFERARASRNRKVTGTGLGLTITRLLTKIMGGDIWVTSEVGKGSIFHVKLMLSEVANPRTVSVMEDRVRSYRGARQTIMVVDDDENHRVLVQDLLEPLDFNVLTASSGAECLELAERHKPNLILLDVAMPDMDGWQVAEKLRQMRPDRPAIIMLSAFAPDPKHKAEPYPLNDDYLIKPFDLRQLLGKIYALLDIEWVHNDSLAEPQIITAEMLTPTMVPSPSDLDELIGLGQIGYMRGIQNKLHAIENASPEYGAFVSYMRVISDGFDLKRYVAVLESFRSDHG